MGTLHVSSLSPSLPASRKARVEGQMAAPRPHWDIAGEYFENCNCKVVCPCLLSPNPPLTSKPTEGDCKTAFAFHIKRGSHRNETLDGFNLALIANTTGALAEGYWYGIYYFGERATEY